MNSRVTNHVVRVTNGFIFYGATPLPLAILNQRLRMGRSRAHSVRAVVRYSRADAYERAASLGQPFVFCSHLKFIYLFIYSRLSIERTADESTCMLLVRLEAGLQARSGRSARRLPKHRRRPGADAALRGLGGARRQTERETDGPPMTHPYYPQGVVHPLQTSGKSNGHTSGVTAVPRAAFTISVPLFRILSPAGEAVVRYVRGARRE